VRFGFSTIERWYYRALKERTDPVGKLRRKRRADAGRQPAMSDALRQAVLAQYAAHKGWSARLHHDNLIAFSEKCRGKHRARRARTCPRRRTGELRPLWRAIASFLKGVSKEECHAYLANSGYT
jgi:hypothetical protein